MAPPLRPPRTSDTASPITLINARIDRRRSDSDRLEPARQEAGVKVEHNVHAGTTHEFFGMAAVVSEAKDAQKLAGKQLKAQLK